MQASDLSCHKEISLPLHCLPNSRSASSPPTAEAHHSIQPSSMACASAGFPSVGKSTILTVLTGTTSEVAAYEFTTLTCIPGIIHYNEAKIQLLDLPGIIEGAAEGKGRGPYLT